MSNSAPPDVAGEVTPKASRAAVALMPSFQLYNRSWESTPPPMESPLPRTPKPQRFLNPPRTPLAKTTNPFGEDPDNGGVGTSMLHAGMTIARPPSACSTNSCFSDSSIDSNITYVTADGSCTSFEDDELEAMYDTPKGKAPLNEDAYILSAMSERQIQPVSSSKGKEKVGHKRETQWTEEMDAHLWRTYVLYQQDPKMTPFFVLPGQVPPLGVCCKVAREAKKSWTELRLCGKSNYTPVTPKPRSRRAVTPTAVATTNNRGYTWPASKSSTRRRLRELCRQNYGPNRNPYHGHQQKRSHATDLKARSTTSPSPLRSSGGPLPNAFSTTRGLALSLTTSTASSMRPTGALASLTGGRDITPVRPSFQFGSITERMESAHAVETGVLSTGSLKLGVDISSAFTTPKHRGHRRQLSLDSNAPSLLPPLELKTSHSSYGTCPRSPTRAEDDGAEETTPVPARSRARRGTLGDIFGDDTAVPSATAPITARPRTRGYTIAAGTNPLGTRKRTAKASAPLLTVTGPVNYEGDRNSPTDMREGRFEEALPSGPKRLGSPFQERGRDF